MTPLFTLPTIEALKGLMWHPVQSVCEAKPSQRDGELGQSEQHLELGRWFRHSSGEGNSTNTVLQTRGSTNALRFDKGNWESQAMGWARGAGCNFINGLHQSVIPKNTATLAVQGCSLSTARVVTEGHV